MEPDRDLATLTLKSWFLSLGFSIRFVALLPLQGLSTTVVKERNQVMIVGVSTILLN